MYRTLAAMPLLAAFLLLGFAQGAYSADTDSIHLTVLAEKSGMVGAEIGAETDWYSPHDFVAGFIGMVPLAGQNSAVDAVRGLAGFGGTYIGYRLRPKSTLSPFLGMSGLSSFLVSDTPYYAVMPEAGFSYRCSDRFEIGIGSRYYFMTSGRDNDLWTLGLTLSYRLR